MPQQELTRPVRILVIGDDSQQISNLLRAYLLTHKSNIPEVAIHDVEDFTREVDAAVTELRSDKPPRSAVIDVLDFSSVRPRGSRITGSGRSCQELTEHIALIMRRFDDVATLLSISTPPTSTKHLRIKLHRKTPALKQVSKAHAGAARKRTHLSTKTHQPVRGRGNRDTSTRRRSAV